MFASRVVRIVAKRKSSGRRKRSPHVLVARALWEQTRESMTEARIERGEAVKRAEEAEELLSHATAFRFGVSSAHLLHAWDPNASKWVAMPGRLGLKESAETTRDEAIALARQYEADGKTK